MTALHFSLSDDGENSLFDFILQAHQLIKAGAIPIKEWQEIVKIIFQQMIQCTEYLHSKHTDPNFIRSVVGKDDYNHYIHPKRLAKTLQGSIWKATRNDNSNNQNYIGNTFSLKRKTNNDDVNSPNKGLSIKLDEDENTMDNERIINSNGVNIVNDKNGVDYLMGFGFEHGIKIKDNKTTDEKDGEKKNFYFKLPAEAKQYVTKQAESLEIPKTALVLMLGVLTTSGPIPVAHYRGWKTNNPNIVGLLNPKNISQINKNKPVNKVDIVPNLDSLTDSSDKNSDALSSNKSPINVGEISRNSQCSPVGSIGSTPAATALFNDNTSNGSKRSSPLNQSVNKKILPKKMVISNSNTSILTKAPLVNKGSFNNNKNKMNTTQSAPATTRRMFQYPNNSALGTSQLFEINSRNLLNNKLNTNPLTLVSPRGVSLIRMKSNGPTTLLSPTAAALLSPRRTGINNNSLIGSNVGPPSVVVPNDFSPMKQNIGNGFSMTTPIANLTPVHIPFMQQNTNNTMNGQSPMNSGFQSPINYNISTPQSPLGGTYSGITPIISAFTPTATGVNAITPTTNLPFYWSNIHKTTTNGNGNTNTMGNMSMVDDPLAPHNIPPFMPQNNMNMNNNMNNQQQNQTNGPQNVNINSPNQQNNNAAILQALANQQNMLQQQQVAKLAQFTQQATQSLGGGLFAGLPPHIAQIVQTVTPQNTIQQAMGSMNQSQLAAYQQLLQNQNQTAQIGRPLMNENDKDEGNTLNNKDNENNDGTMEGNMNTSLKDDAGSLNPHAKAFTPQIAPNQKSNQQNNQQSQPQQSNTVTPSTSAQQLLTQQGQQLLTQQGQQLLTQQGQQLLTQQ
eukprot:34030_1